MSAVDSVWRDMTTASDTSWKTRLPPTDSVAMCIQAMGADVLCLPQREINGNLGMYFWNRKWQQGVISVSQVILICSGNRFISDLNNTYNLLFT